MISYFIQLVVISFTFGFGIGSAIYALSIIAMDKLNYIAKNEVRRIVREEIIDEADDHQQMKLKPMPPLNGEDRFSESKK